MVANGGAQVQALCAAIHGDSIDAPKNYPWSPPTASCAGSAPEISQRPVHFVLIVRFPRRWETKQEALLRQRAGHPASCGAGRGFPVKGCLSVGVPVCPCRDAARGLCVKCASQTGDIRPLPCLRSEPHPHLLELVSQGLVCVAEGQAVLTGRLSCLPETVS